jgi:hypothetical protein
MRADRIGQAWPRGSRCRRARRLRLRRKRRATAAVSEALAAGAIKQSPHTLDQRRARRLFPVGVLIACVAVILGIVFLLF